MDQARKIIRETIQDLINNPENDGVPKYINLDKYIEKLEVDKNFAYKTLESLYMIFFHSNLSPEDILIDAGNLIEKWEQTAG